MGGASRRQCVSRHRRSEAGMKDGTRRSRSPLGETRTSVWWLTTIYVAGRPVRAPENQLWDRGCVCSTMRTNAGNGRKESDSLLVVAVGASAGGVAALRQFFPRRRWEEHRLRGHPASVADHDSLACGSVAGRGALAGAARRRSHPSPKRITSTSCRPTAVSRSPMDRSTVSDITCAEQRRSPVDVFFRALADA